MRFTMLCLTVLLTAAPGTAQQIEKNKYQQIEVMRFTVAEGVKFPPDYLVSMNEELATELRSLKKFAAVLHEGETAAADAAPRLKLEGAVTEYAPGNRAVRYLVGFGAGKTKVVAQVRFVDAATGETVLEKKVDGKVVLGGALMSDSAGATRGLAKEVAKLARQRFF